MTILPIYKNKEAEKKKTLIDDINKRMGISNNEDLNDKLCLFFATEDKNNKLPGKTDNDYADEYKLYGFYVNIDLEGIPQPWPYEVNCIIGKFCKHLIWVSKTICEDERINFAWNYSHELQHLKQSLNNPFLIIVANLLKDIEDDIYEVPEIDLPTEFDCERKAKETVISIFGEDECDLYLKNMKAGSTANNKRYSKLLELDITKNFDVEQKLQNDIRTNKSQVKCIQKRWQAQRSTNWNIDIKELCSIKDPHKAILTTVTKKSLLRGQEFRENSGDSILNY